MNSRRTLKQIKGSLGTWKVSGSYDTYEKDDPRRTFITNLDRKDHKRIVQYVKIAKDFGLDYEFQSAAFDTLGNQHDYMISFYIKGPHQDMKWKIIDAMIKSYKEW